MTPTTQLHVGNCREVLKGLPENSIDAVVTDPPYGLSQHGDIREPLERWLAGESYVHRRAGFLQCEWDSFPPGPDIWKEVYRVLKPGGHLLAFAGSRTMDLMSIAIRLAGFENRDSISVEGTLQCLRWEYSQGFPKSLDVSKAIERKRHDNILPICHFLRQKIEENGISHQDISRHFGFSDRMVGHWIAQTERSQPTIPTPEQWEELKGILGFGNEMDEQFYHLSNRKGQLGDVWYEREVTGQHEEDSFGEWHARYGTQRGLNPKEKRDIPVTQEASRWKGWGTSLNPAWEPLLVFKKPTGIPSHPMAIAENVMTFGTGAMNLDACRVASSDPVTAHSRSEKGGKSKGVYGDFHFQETHQSEGQKMGRWPSNLVYCHHPACVLKGTQQAKATSGGIKTVVRKAGGAHQEAGGHMTPGRENPYKGYGNSEGQELVEVWECHPSCPIRELNVQSRIGDDARASRFFPSFGWTSDDPYFGFKHCPKASRRERNAGCEHLPVRRGRMNMSGKCVNCGKGRLDGCREGPCCDNPEYNNEEMVFGDVPNFHPTVKPVALMRWACRLVTPPGGTILDPFMGIGTTGVAAVREGFNFVGVEMSKEYHEVASARVNHALTGEDPALKRMLQNEGSPEQGTASDPASPEDLFGC